MERLEAVLAALGTHGAVELEGVGLPHVHQARGQLVHHGAGVVGGGGAPQPLLPHGHRRVVDGLHVHPVSLHQVVGHLRAHLRISHLIRKN